VLVRWRAPHELDAEARFEVPNAKLFAFIQSLAADAAVRPIRSTMIDGWRALADGDHDAAARAYGRAEEMSRGRGQTRELAASLLALGGVALARGDTEGALRMFKDAALAGERVGLAGQTAQAWKAAAALAKSEGATELADVASGAARKAAERLGLSAFVKFVAGAG